VPRKRKSPDRVAKTPASPPSAGAETLANDALLRSAPSSSLLRRGTLLRLLVVMLAAFALYARTLGFGFTHLDDDVLVLEDQSFLAEPSSPWQAFARPYFQMGSRDHAYYRPLVTASLGLDAQFSGPDPFAYHLTNVLLHALASGLVFSFLREVGQREGPALFGAFVFAAHPALTEAVAWIPGRTDTALAVFALISWLFFVRASRSGAWLHRGAHLLAWLGALLCKELALVLPLLFALELVLRERRTLRSWLTPWPVLGWLLVLGAYFALRTNALRGQSGVEGVSVASFLANAPVLLSSFGKLVLPVQLSVLSTREGDWLWPGVLALAFVAWRLFAIQPASERRIALLALAGVAITVVPSLPASSVLTLENRLYLPAMALALLCAELGARWAAPARSKAWAAGAVVAVLGAVSFVYSGGFRDRLTFSEAAVRGSPRSSLARRNLGVTYQLAGDVVAARREYEAALAADPNEPVVHNNLAVIWLRQGLMADAERELRKELAINPGYAPARQNLAIVLRALGRPAEADLANSAVPSTKAKP
jgi:tetratricopeptide (TPR) repeat protein